MFDAGVKKEATEEDAPDKEKKLHSIEIEMNYPSILAYLADLKDPVRDR